MLRASLILLLTFSILACNTTPPQKGSLPDGSVFNGSLVNGKLHGHGTLVWGNGDKYEGDFRDGLMHGDGVFQGYRERYEGEFENGMYHGEGKLFDNDRLVYEGEFERGRFHGEGKLYWKNEDTYEGEFSQGRIEGEGVWVRGADRFEGSFKNDRVHGFAKQYFDDELVYEGHFENDLYHGKGKYNDGYGIWEGEYVEGQLQGEGTYTSEEDGFTYTGGFKDGRYHGKGELRYDRGDYYQGEFEDGSIVGTAIHADNRGNKYEGEFEYWRYHGQGVFTYENGDRYVGEFKRGKFHGKAVLHYAKPKDGKDQLEGEWKRGSLYRDENGDLIEKENLVEKALYSESNLLQKVLTGLAANDPLKPEVYFVGVAGDGKQRVFHREVNFVREKVAQKYDIEGRSALLINNRKEMGKLPMATHHSIEKVINAVAERMDKDNDVLFLYMTSHGSKDHQFYLNQRGISLNSLPAELLDKKLDDAGIKWRVIVISACYSGGFIDHLNDENSLIITAAASDKTSFGCSDDADLTYFARALFEKSFNAKEDWQSMFRQAKEFVTDWEEDEELEPSNPQIHVGKNILAKLKTLEK